MGHELVTVEDSDGCFETYDSWDAAMRCVAAMRDFEFPEERVAHVRVYTLDTVRAEVGSFQEWSLTYEETFNEPHPGLDNADLNTDR